jgi:hypothetical protein
MSAQGCAWPQCFSWSSNVDSPASFAPSTPHKQAGSWLSGRSTSELRTEATSSRHQADANTSPEVIRNVLRCKMGRRWGRLGAPKPAWVWPGQTPWDTHNGHRARYEPTLLRSSRSGRAYGLDVVCISSPHNHPVADTITNQYHIHPAYTIPFHLSLQT